MAKSRAGKKGAANAPADPKPSSEPSASSAAQAVEEDAPIEDVPLDDDDNNAAAAAAAAADDDDDDDVFTFHDEEIPAEHEGIAPEGGVEPEAAAEPEYDYAAAAAEPEPEAEAAVEPEAEPEPEPVAEEPIAEPEAEPEAAAAADDAAAVEPEAEAEAASAAEADAEAEAATEGIPAASDDSAAPAAAAAAAAAGAGVAAVAAASAAEIEAAKVAKMDAFLEQERVYADERAPALADLQKWHVRLVAHLASQRKPVLSLLSASCARLDDGDVIIAHAIGQLDSIRAVHTSAVANYDASKHVFGVPSVPGVAPTLPAHIADDPTACGIASLAAMSAAASHRHMAAARACSSAVQDIKTQLVGYGAAARKRLEQEITLIEALFSAAQAADNAFGELVEAQKSRFDAAKASAKITNATEKKKAIDALWWRKDQWAAEYRYRRLAGKLWQLHKDFMAHSRETISTVVVLEAKRKETLHTVMQTAIDAHGYAAAALHTATTSTALELRRAVAPGSADADAGAAGAAAGAGAVADNNAAAAAAAAAAAGRQQSGAATEGAAAGAGAGAGADAGVDGPAGMAPSGFGQVARIDSSRLSSLARKLIELEAIPLPIFMRPISGADVGVATKTPVVIADDEECPAPGPFPPSGSIVIAGAIAKEARLWGASQELYAVFTKDRFLYLFHADSLNMEPAKDDLLGPGAFSMATTSDPAAVRFALKKEQALDKAAYHVADAAYLSAEQGFEDGAPCKRFMLLYKPTGFFTTKWEYMVQAEDASSTMQWVSAVNRHFRGDL